MGLRVVDEIDFDAQRYANCLVAPWKSSREDHSWNEMESTIRSWEDEPTQNNFFFQAMIKKIINIFAELVHPHVFKRIQKYTLKIDFIVIYPNSLLSPEGTIVL